MRLEYSKEEILNDINDELSAKKRKKANKPKLGKVERRVLKEVLAEVSNSSKDKEDSYYQYNGRDMDEWN